jgi:hypothetical protein
MDKSRKKIIVFSPVFLISFLLLCTLSFPQSESLKIFQTDNRIQIDGILDDWAGVAEIPVNLTPAG